MSYCSFSSDDFQCDVHCYGTGDGFTTHVASNRPVIDRSKLPELKDGNMMLHIDCLNAIMDQLDTAERKDIGLPHDGKTFHDETAREAANTLKMLRSCGYNVPKYAIETLEEEAKDGDTMA